MSRIFGMFLSFGIIAAASATSVWAIAPLSGEKPDIMPSKSLIIPAKQLTEKQKCKALNRCRQKYTHCENKLTSLHELADLDEKCVKPYQKCIHSNFSGGEWFFTRWFNPSYLDCRQY